MTGDYKSNFRSNTNPSKPKPTTSSSGASSSSQSNGNNNNNDNSNAQQNQNPSSYANFKTILQTYGKSAKLFSSKILSRIILFFSQLSEQNKMLIGVAFLGILFYFLIYAGENGGGGMWGSRVDRGRGRGRAGERSNIGEAYHTSSNPIFDSEARTERESEGVFNNKNNPASYSNGKSNGNGKTHRDAEAAAGIHGYSTRANAKRKKEYDDKYASSSPPSASASPQDSHSYNYDDQNQYDNNREIPQYYDHGNQHHDYHNYGDTGFFGNFGYIFDTTYGLSWPLWAAILAGAYKLPPYFPDQLGPQYARPFFGMNMVNFAMFLNMFSNSMRGRGRGGGGGLGGIANMFTRRRY